MTTHYPAADNLLVELFVEELPPKALKKLGEAFAAVLFERLQAQGLTRADSLATAYASPRRLAVHVRAVLPQAPNKSVSAKLMPVSVGFDAAGNATPALLKKLAALGADASALGGLQRAMDGKAEALFFASTVQGASLTEGLQAALNDAIAKLPIPKVMTYQLQGDCELPGWTSVSFVRPAHGLVALHGQRVVPVQALGLKAGNRTQGHRFEAAVSPVVFKDADSYAHTLRTDGAVIASYAERSMDMVRQLRAKARALGARLEVETLGLTEADAEETLLEHPLVQEVTALVERPHVLVCEFEKQFLEVPQECLILTMKANQKYFPLLDAQGTLSNQFLVVSNISPQDASAVIGGNERVVRPRLADAKFFFDQDRKTTLEARVASLAKVVYHNKLGTQGERSQRVQAIAEAIALQGVQAGWQPYASDPNALVALVKKAALLAKTDLLTDMVGEFPELQGVMGRYYAQHDGHDPLVAEAIEDHYKPRFAGDALPRSDVGLVVALADKLETLAGMFGIGNLPTGDKDPFALRRHALGVVRMLVEKDLPLNLFAIVEAAFAAFNAGATGTAQAQASEVAFDSSSRVALTSFMFDRLAGSLREQGYSAQEVDAVLALQPQCLGEVPKRLDAVRAFAALAQSPALAAANKRIGNILKKAEAAAPDVQTALLQEPAEQALYRDMQTVLPQAHALWQAGDYTASLQSLAALRAPVDAFFQDVMVNAEQADLRRNRLGLLQSLHIAMNRVADLSKLAA